METTERRVHVWKKSGEDDLFKISLKKLGKRIAAMRKQRKFTQEDVAFHLCVATSTISRIEKGKLMPTRYLLRPMFQMFNQSFDDSVVMLLDGGDSYEDDMFDELRIAVRDRNLGEIRSLLAKVNETKLAGKKMYLSLYLYAKVLAEPGLEAHTAIDGMLEAIRVTKPEFNLESISGYRLRFDEITIINGIGAAYLSHGDFGTAAKVFEDTAKSMDTFYLNEHLKCEMYPGILYNLSTCYGLQARYQEAEQICQTARKLAVKYGKHGALPYLLYNIGRAKIEQGDIDGCLEMTLQAYVTASAMGNPFAEQIKINAEQELGIDLSVIQEQLLQSADPKRPKD